MKQTTALNTTSNSSLVRYLLFLLMAVSFMAFSLNLSSGIKEKFDPDQIRSEYLKDIEAKADSSAQKNNNALTRRKIKELRINNHSLIFD